MSALHKFPHHYLSHNPCKDFKYSFDLTFCSVPKLSQAGYINSLKGIASNYKWISWLNKMNALNWFISANVLEPLEASQEERKCLQNLRFSRLPSQSSSINLFYSMSTEESAQFNEINTAKDKPPELNCSVLMQQHGVCPDGLMWDNVLNLCRVFCVRFTRLLCNPLS